MNLFGLEPGTTVFLILFFLLGLFIGARIPFGRGSKKTGDKEGPRQSSHYIIGMYAMLTGDVETAIEHLGKVVELSTEPVEVYLALGALYRKRGQVDRAIRVHQTLLTRAGLPDAERVLALNALGMDFRTGGLIDRALKTFRDALALNPKDPDALYNLVKISEDLGEWTDAYDYASRLQKIKRHKDPRLLSYLLAQKGNALANDGQLVKASWSLHRAIRLFSENMVAYTFLIRLFLKAEKPEKAKKTIAKAVKRIPHRAFMVMGLLKETYAALEDTRGYLEALHTLGHKHHQKRALLQELQEYADLRQKERIPPVLRELVGGFGRSRLVHRTLWDLVRRGLLDDALFPELAEIFAGSDQMLDFFTCMSCGYKTQEILNRCPNCKEWNSFSDGEG